MAFTGENIGTGLAALLGPSVDALIQRKLRRMQGPDYGGTQKALGGFLSQLKLRILSKYFQHHATISQ
jgi:hypothetical protein